MNDKAATVQDSREDRSDRLSVLTARVDRPLERPRRRRVQEAHCRVQEAHHRAPVVHRVQVVVRREQVVLPVEPRQRPVSVWMYVFVVADLA